MKKIIISFVFIMVVSICIGCGEAYDNTACYYSVKKAYPDCKVYILPKAKYRFLVIKGDKIIYVITNSMYSTDITSEYVLQEGE